jgi:integrase
VKGHLRRRGGAWQLVVDAGRDPLTGKRRQITRTVRANRREAERQLTQLVALLTSSATKSSLR